MSDLVERLRADVQRVNPEKYVTQSLMLGAADEIERLRDWQRRAVWMVELHSTRAKGECDCIKACAECLLAEALLAEAHRHE